MPVPNELIEIKEFLIFLKGNLSILANCEEVETAYLATGLTHRQKAKIAQHCVSCFPLFQAKLDLLIACLSNPESSNF